MTSFTKRIRSKKKQNLCLLKVLESEESEGAADEDDGVQADAQVGLAGGAGAGLGGGGGLGGFGGGVVGLGRGR